ncbi:MAG TPA: DNA repair protein RecO [Rectinema sp.]|nr:DNA repair protein RecO [Rectinema sp.]
MAQRNERYRGLFLHAKDTARGDRILTFLCNEGLLSLFMFGGPKSSLRSAALPFIVADVEVYHDTRREFIKLTGANVFEVFDGINKSFSHMQSAYAASEFLIRTSAFGGEYPQALSMITALLRELANVDESEALLVLSAFFWNALSPLGLIPDLLSCERCGRSFSEKNSLPGKLLIGESSFLCHNCAEEFRQMGFSTSAMLPFDEKVLTCLRIITKLSYSEALPLLKSASLRPEIIAIIESLAESAAEGPLQSLRVFGETFYGT